MLVAGISSLLKNTTFSQLRFLRQDGAVATRAAPPPKGIVLDRTNGQATLHLVSAFIARAVDPQTGGDA